MCLPDYGAQYAKLNRMLKYWTSTSIAQNTEKIIGIDRLSISPDDSTFGSDNIAAIDRNSNEQRNK